MKRRIVACVMVISMLALTACGNKTDEQKTTTGVGVNSETTVKQNGTNEEAKGRYVETEISLSEDIRGIMKIKELEDGTIRLIAMTGIYDSHDGGINFEKLEIEDFILDDNHTIIRFADCNKDGEMIIGKLNYGKEGSEQEYEMQVVLIDKDQTVSEIEIPLEKGVALEDGNSSRVIQSSIEIGSDEEGNDEKEFEVGNVMVGSMEGNHDEMVEYASFLPNGNYLVATSMGIFQMDKDSGEKVVTYGDGSVYLNGAVALENQLIIDGYMELYTYDINTGAIQETNPLIQEFVQMNQDMQKMIIGGSYQLAMMADEQALYVVNRDGIYRYVENASVKEELVNSSLNSLSNPEYTYGGIEKTKDHSFYVSLFSQSGVEKLVKYTYDENAQTAPSQEIKVYALTDSPQIRQAVSMHQQKNQGVYISLEIGMPEGGQVTATDAIRNLNTSILAGEGPDIILLDGLPVDSYIEKNTLVDLTEVIEEVSASEGLFETVVKTYEQEGKIYAVPTKFSIDVLIAQEEILNQYKDLNGLAEVLEELKKADSEKLNILNAIDAEQLVECFYNTSSGSWKNVDGTLNEEGIKEFITALNRIYNVINKESQEEDSIGMTTDSTISMQIINALILESAVTTVPVSSIGGVAYITSFMKQVEGRNFAMLNGQVKNAYVPVTTIGVSAKSENQDLAKEFVKTLLSKELQASSLEAGLPVNRAAFEELTSQSNAEMVNYGIVIENGDGRLVTLDITFPKEEEFVYLQEMIEQLEIPADTNSVIKEVVTSEIVNGFESGKSIDEITANILQTVNLYLAE
jgi:ABC-type sugar transport system, periplasmic component